MLQIQYVSKGRRVSAHNSPKENRWICCHNTRRILREDDSCQSSPQSVRCSSVGPGTCDGLCWRLIGRDGNQTVLVQPKYLPRAVLLSAAKAMWTDHCCPLRTLVWQYALHRAHLQWQWTARHWLAVWSLLQCLVRSTTWQKLREVLVLGTLYKIQYVLDKCSTLMLNLRAMSMRLLFDCTAWIIDATRLFGDWTQLANCDHKEPTYISAARYMCRNSLRSVVD